MVLMRFEAAPTSTSILHQHSILNTEEKDDEPAVQTANTSCRESKNKNITSRDSDAPRGKNIAWYESSVDISTNKIYMPTLPNHS